MDCRCLNMAVFAGVALAFAIGAIWPFLPHSRGRRLFRVEVELRSAFGRLIDEPV